MVDAVFQVTTIDPNKVEIVFSKTDGWGKYIYQYNVTVINKTGVLITYWQIDITLPDKTKYQNGWNALFEENNEKLIII